MDKDLAERLAPVILSLWAGADLDEILDANSALNDWDEEIEDWFEEHRDLLYLAAAMVSRAVVRWLEASGDVSQG